MPVTYGIEQVTDQDGNQVAGFFTIVNQNEIWLDLSDFAMDGYTSDLIVVYKASYTANPDLWISSQMLLTIINCEA